MKKISIFAIVLALSFFVIAVAPVIDTTPINVGTVNIPYTYDVNATDSDGDTLTFSLTNPPSGMTIDSSTGLITWTPNAAGSYNVTVSASDATDSAIQSYLLNISETLPSIEISELFLGSPSTKRSNPRSDEDEAKEVYVDGLFTITNNGNSPITEVKVGSTASQNRFNITFKNEPVTLNAGEQKTVTIKAKVPADLRSFFAGRPKPNEDRSEQIGTITISGKVGTSTVSGNNKLWMEAENNLEYLDFSLRVNNREIDVNDGDSVSNARPGETIPIEIFIENTYKSNDFEDLDIEDIEIEIDGELKDLDFNDKRVNFQDLRSNSKTDEIVDIFIEEDAKDSTRELEFVLTGKDENGALHGERIKFSLKIERLQNDVSLRKLQLSKNGEELCFAEEIDLSGSVNNRGKRDQRGVNVKAQSAELEFTKRIANFDLDRDEKRNFNIKIPLKRLEEGNYPIIVESFYDGTTTNDRQALVLTVPDCFIGTTDDVPTQDNSVLNSGDSDSDFVLGPIIHPQSSIPEVKDGEDEDNNTLLFVLIGLLALGVLLLVGAGVYLLISLAQ